MSATVSLLVAALLGAPAAPDAKATNAPQGTKATNAPQGAKAAKKKGKSGPVRDDCLFCHRAATERASRPAKLFALSIHREKGITCADCHGGHARRGGLTSAHDRKAGFRGVPRGMEVIKTCARCHSDPKYMKQFNPSPRVDQEAEYWTSQHGILLKQGDHNVATCTECHGSHLVRRVKDPNSPVYPLNVAETCGRCHANKKMMKRYKIPTNQLALYKKSVHYHAMVKKRDTSAATCNDCHGNHGASPPGAKDISAVCGQCHVFFQQLFEKSAHNKKMKKGCIACHGNHGIQKPTDEWLGTARGQACEKCHAPPSKAGVAAGKIRTLVLELKEAVTKASDVLKKAHHAGLEVRKPTFALRGAKDKLTEARKVVHGLRPEDVKKTVEAGLVIARKSLKKGEEALEQIGYRRRGLLWALGALVLLAFGLWLKLRQIERRPKPKEPPAE